MDFDEIRGG